MASIILSVIQLKKHLSHLEFYLQVIDCLDLPQRCLLIEAIMTVLKQDQLNNSHGLFLFGVYLIG